MKTFVLWGGTGQAKVLHEALLRRGHTVALIVDNRPIPSPLPHTPIVHGVEGLYGWLQQHRTPQLYGLAAIGGHNGPARLEILDIFSQHGILEHTLVHDRAFVAEDACVAPGAQILAMSAVCSHTHIGRGVIVNTAASVDHDCRIQDGVHIAPGVTIAGDVTIEACAFIGVGAVVLPGVVIGAHATVGAGAVVTKNVPARSVVVGNPAKLHTSR